MSTVFGGGVGSGLDVCVCVCENVNMFTAVPRGWDKRKMEGDFFVLRRVKLNLFPLPWGQRKSGFVWKSAAGKLSSERRSAWVNWELYYRVKCSSFAEEYREVIWIQQKLWKEKKVIDALVSVTQFLQLAFNGMTRWCFRESKAASVEERLIQIMKGRE